MPGPPGRMRCMETTITARHREGHERGAATIYVSDVGPDHEDFAAVQWWATGGGLHGLAPPPGRPGERGEQIDGQYYEAFPGHDAHIDRPLDSELRKRWTRLARDRAIDPDALADSRTRGDFIRRAHRLARAARS